jgi:hypothetical protein
MALSLLELDAVTDYYVDRRPQDIYFKSNVLLYKLLGNGQIGNKLIDGGRKIKIILEYDAGNAGAYGNTSTLPVNKKDVFNAALFPWAAYYGGLTIDLEDKRDNAGTEAIIRLVEGKLKNSEKSIRNQMGTQIYNARSSNTGPQGETNVGFTGLEDLFNTSTSTAYGEIAEDDMSLWKANVTTTSEALVFSVFQGMRRSASVDDTNEGMPNLYITTDTLRDGFEASLHTQARYQDTELVNAGFMNILFDGAPVVQDNKCGSGVCYGLNTRYLDILTHRDYNFTRPRWASPINQPDVEVAFIKWSGNLVCKHRGAHVKHTNLTAPS